MIESGSASKYLFYAIGEIALVVLGILIALQINNWNEDKKRRNTEVNLLLELKDNLTTDLHDIRYNINEDSETLLSNEIILDQFEKKIPFHDSLSKHYGGLQRTSTFVENISAFENLKTLGFDLISNDTLRRKISNLYSARYNYIDEINTNTSNRFVWDLLNPLLLKNLRSNVVLEDAVPLDPISLSKNSTFLEALRWHIAIKKFSINLNKDTEIEIVKVIEFIQKEIGDFE